MPPRLTAELVAQSPQFLNTLGLYELDLRLRPSGRKGLVVTSRAAWRSYLTERAAPFERMAAARARRIAPTRGAFADAVDRVLGDALVHPRDVSRRSDCERLGGVE